MLNSPQGCKGDVRGFYGLACLPAVFFHILDFLLNRKAMMRAANVAPIACIRMMIAKIGGGFDNVLYWTMASNTSQNIRASCAIEAIVKAVWPLPWKNLIPATIKVNAMHSVMNDSP